jgi:hypothetical protein
VRFAEFVGFVEFVEFIGFQWRYGRDAVEIQRRLLEISGDKKRYIRNANAKAQMTNKVQMPKCQRAWGQGLGTRDRGLEIGDTVDIQWRCSGDALKIHWRWVKETGDT